MENIIDPNGLMAMIFYVKNAFLSILPQDKEDASFFNQLPNHKTFIFISDHSKKNTNSHFV